MEQRKDELGELNASLEPDRAKLKEEIAAVLAETQKPISPEELERRRKLTARILKLREEIGPIDTSITDLVRQVREGEEDPGD